ncbi:MAG: TetR/AcrR family transcriptional regulator [Burkholderiaceae bacterium]
MTRDLLIRDGYAGFRFHDLAEQLGVTRASIHYHFVSKQRLCEETIVEAVAQSSRLYQSMLIDGEEAFHERIRRIMEMNRSRYLHYNPTGKTSNPWALISRMRLEQHELTEPVRRELAAFRSSLEKNIEISVKLAIKRGELMLHTPARTLALMLIAIINSSDPTTRDTSSFKRMEELYLGYLELVAAAYGAAKK